MVGSSVRPRSLDTGSCSLPQQVDAGVRQAAEDFERPGEIELGQLGVEQQADLEAGFAHRVAAPYFCSGGKGLSGAGDAAVHRLAERDAVGIEHRAQGIIELHLGLGIGADGGDFVGASLRQVALGLDDQEDVEAPSVYFFCSASRVCSCRTRAFTEAW